MSTETPESALCHGPGCRREQTVPYWCGERCQAAWDARWGKSLPDAGFAGLLGESIRVAVEHQQVSEAIAEQMQPVSGATAMANLAELTRRIAAVEVPQSIKLTHGQLNAIRIASPVYPEYAHPSTFAGVPVVLVDTVEESTPYQRAFPDAPESQRGAAYPQVASEGPQVARGWLGRWLGRMFGKEQP